MGGLDLSSPEGIRRGGVSGPVLVAGKGSQSLLVRRLKGLDGKPQMPMGFKPLEATKIALVSSWIDQGASFEASTSAQHWSYVPPERPALPSVTQRAWVRNEVDAFVLSRLEREGVAPSPQADKATLVRRVYLDLIGKTPTIEEME